MRFEDTIAVCIPAHRPRLDELLGCIETMRGPGIEFVVVTNEPNPIHEKDLPEDVFLINTHSEEINLSKWWNLGLRWARIQGLKSFMVTESDVRLRPEKVWLLHETLWDEGFSMVGPNLYGGLMPGTVQVETSQSGWGGRHVGNRICQTWMVKTDEALPADERFAWWHSDEQHEMRHRALGNGTAIVGTVTYERPLFQSTDPDANPILSEGILRARNIFHEEWGFPVLI